VSDGELSHDAIRAYLDAARVMLLHVDFGENSKSREDTTEAVWWIDKAIEDLGEAQ
jgi:hypothetical protein